MSSSPSPQPVIIGGGIAGLAAAYTLVKAGIPATIVERLPRLGGVITTEVVDGCVIEGGPDSFLTAKPWALELIEELGLGADVISSNDHERVTYVWKGARLVPLPDGLMMMVPTKVLPMALSPLLGWKTKLRMGWEYFRKASPDGGRDRSVAEFIEDHYGREAVEYLAEPLLAGVYGGDPNQLSIVATLGRFADLERTYGSLTRGVLAARAQAAAAGTGAAPLFQTLKGGLGQLVNALEHAIAKSVRRITAEAETVVREGAGFRIRVNGDWLAATHVVVATPAHAAAGLLATADASLGELLGQVPYSSSMTVALGYRREELNHPLNGFGFLVPRLERRRLVACTWVGTKFPYRVPPTHAVLRCFLGGANDGGILVSSEDSLLVGLQDELRAIMGVTAAPSFVRISRWPQSMAQYTVGHTERVARIEERLKTTPGLYLAGNAYYGIGVPDCIRMGRQAARAIAACR